MIRLKPGVSLKDLQPQAAVMLAIVASVYRDMGVQDCWVTSANDSTHGTNSLHYKGLALDFRTHGLRESGVDPEEVAEKAKAALGREFDVILEDRFGQNEHVHGEYDIS